MSFNVKELQAIKDGGFYNNKDGTWNSIIVFPGENVLYRHRVETIVIRNNKEVFVKKCTNEKYFLPGGSTEKNVSKEEQAIHECNEEAHINVKNIKFTGITYKEEHDPPEWAKTQCDVLWRGSYTEIYTAEYDGKFNEEVEKVDEDPFIRSGRWYSFKECFSFFRKEHARALSNYIVENQQNRDNAKDELISESYITNYFKNKKFLKKVARNNELNKNAVEDMIRAIKNKNVELKSTSKVQRLTKDKEKAKSYFFPVLDLSFPDGSSTGIVISYDTTEFSPAAAIHTDEYGDVVIIYPGFFKDNKETQIYTLLHEIGHVRMYHTLSKNQLQHDTNARLHAMYKGKVVYPELNADLYAVLNGASLYAILNSTISKDYDDEYDYRFTNQELANRYSHVFNKLQKLTKESFNDDKCFEIIDNSKSNAIATAIYELVYKNESTENLSDKDKDTIYNIILEYGVVKGLNDDTLNTLKDKYKEVNGDDRIRLYKEYVSLACSLKSESDNIDIVTENCHKPDICYYKDIYKNQFIEMLCDFYYKLNDNIVAESASSRNKFIYLVESITKSERDKIKLSKFGIPEERKYPLDTKKHVESAIRLFGHCEPKYRDELAANLISAMKKYKIDFNVVGQKSSFYPYVKNYIK